MSEILYVTLTHFHVFIVGDDFRGKSVIADDGFILDAGKNDAALATDGSRTCAAGAGRRNNNCGACIRCRAGRARCTRSAGGARSARGARAACDMNISYHTYPHPTPYSYHNFFNIKYRMSVWEQDLKFAKARLTKSRVGQKS